MEFLKIFNTLMSVAFIICYAYQFFYVAVPFLEKPIRKIRGRQKQEKEKAFKYHNYAVLICARNEEAVIANLINSITNQNYPKHLITAFVAADNCTDGTAEAARQAGAVVYTRNNKQLVGKGYALDFLLRKIDEDFGQDNFDGYFVFDADNLISEDYISRMNETFCEGYEIVTSYRNSKNYGDNWISAGYGLWFLRESEFLNHSRAVLGVSGGVSGTGFMFSKNILKDTDGGWPYHLLTEDIEFTAANIVKGNKIGYCQDAVFYDEQPTTFSASVKQRMRWARGFFQVFGKYGSQLVNSSFAKGNFSAYDMMMNLMPAAVLTLVSIMVNGVVSTMEILAGNDVAFIGASVLGGIWNMYVLFFFLGAITLIKAWRKIPASAVKKILHLFSFPLFMMTYIPISVAALFVDVSWRPIAHTDTKSLAAVKNHK